MSVEICVPSSLCIKNLEKSFKRKKTYNLKTFRQEPRFCILLQLMLVFTDTMYLAISVSYDTAESINLRSFFEPDTRCHRHTLCPGQAYVIGADFMPLITG